MTLVEAETLALSTLKQVMEEKVNSSNVEIGAVTAASGKFRIYTKAELDAVIARL